MTAQTPKGGLGLKKYGLAPVLTFSKPKPPKGGLGLHVGPPKGGPTRDGPSQAPPKGAWLGPEEIWFSSRIDRRACAKGPFGAFGGSKFGPFGAKFGLPPVSNQLDRGHSAGLAGQIHSSSATNSGQQWPTVDFLWKSTPDLRQIGVFPVDFLWKCWVEQCKISISVSKHLEIVANPSNEKSAF